jgi:methyl-accepting chemotaxis protein
LISTSGQQVDAGVGLVGETGGALREIATQVSELAAVVAQIAASAHEQTSGLDQVNVAVRQMDQATQQNAAMVEETTAASHKLLEDNSSLSRLLGYFKVSEGAIAELDHRAEAKLRLAG